MIAKCTKNLKDVLFPGWNVWQRDSSPPWCLFVDDATFLLYDWMCAKHQSKHQIFNFWELASDFSCFFRGTWVESLVPSRGCMLERNPTTICILLLFGTSSCGETPTIWSEYVRQKNRKSPKKKYGGNVALLALNVWSSVSWAKSISHTWWQCSWSNNYPALIVVMYDFR